MHRRTSSFARLVSATIAVTLAFTTLLAGVPRAQAADLNLRLFRAEFNSAPVGPLSGTLAVETGAVVPQEGSVTIDSSPTGRALVLESAMDSSGAQVATALLQWSNYPDSLPVTSTEKLALEIKAELSSDNTSTPGASYGLWNGSNFFEFFSFGADGQLTRGGNPVGVTYVPGSVVRTDVRVEFKEGKTPEVTIKLNSSSGKTSLKLPLTSAFTDGALNQLRFQVPANGGTASIDRVEVKLTTDEADEDEPPAVIIIRDGDIEQELENIGGVVFLNIKITIVNTGGMARGTFLVLNLADLGAFFDLADVGFLEGSGYVVEHNTQILRIGLGQNNMLDNYGKVKIKLKFKVKQQSLDIKVNAHFKLQFNDSDGAQEVAVQPIGVVVPVVVAPGITPITITPVLTPTTSVTPTTTLTPTVIIIERLPITSIDVRFVGAWRSRGGLDIFGLPISNPITQPNGIVVQYFERARLEYHPELAGTEYEVLLGLLAVELGYATPPIAVVPADPVERAWYFEGTGHVIGSPFRNYWQNRGGLAIFGLPISEVVVENGLQVQYFERARLELHPELAGTAYEVQLGHLGLQSMEMQAAGGK